MNILLFLKKYWKFELIIIFILSIVFNIFLCRKILSLKDDLNTAQINTEAILDSAKLQKKVMSVNINQLKNYNDSISRKAIDLAKSLKIKPKTITQYDYIESKATKRDTLYLDTNRIIKVDTLKIDTVIGDKWYNVKININRGKLIIEPQMKSQLQLITHTDKEYVNKRSKVFFIRWFQKKRRVLITDIKEANPYIQTTNSRFIKIIK